MGLDIGGSTSRARLRENGQIVADLEAPGANLATLPADLAETRIAELLARLGNLRADACCAGAAGAEIPDARHRLQHQLQSALPGCRVSVVHDTRLVLAAAGLEAGIALVCGTGSVAYGRAEDGREAKRGGWGWMLGDDGSAVWIAREAAREVMRRADAGRSAGGLGEVLLRECNASDAGELTARLHTLHEPMQWASLASPVFDTADDDSAAHDIIERAAVALVDLANRVHDALKLDGPVVLAGGLLLNQSRLERAVRERLTMQSLRLEQPAVEGAVRLAAELLQP